MLCLFYPLNDNVWGEEKPPDFSSLDEILLDDDDDGFKKHNTILSGSETANAYLYNPSAGSYNAQKYHEKHSDERVKHTSSSNNNQSQIFLKCSREEDQNETFGRLKVLNANLWVDIDMLLYQR